MAAVRKASLFATAITLGALSMSPAAARDVILTYKLPKAVVGFGVRHSISKCPGSNGEGVEIDVTTAVKPVYRAGETVRVNVSGHLFVDREVKLEFYDNGTLKSFNGTSTGQGGKLVAAGIKLAAFVGSAAAGAPVAAQGATNLGSRPVLACHDWVVGAIAAKAATAAYLQSLEAQVVASGLSDTLADEIGSAKARIAALDAMLSVDAEPKYWIPSADALSYSASMKAGDISVWFKPVPDEGLDAALEKAGYGQMQVFALEGSVKPMPPPAPTIKEKEAARSLVYREPAIATISMKPMDDFFMPEGSDRVKLALAAQAYAATRQDIKVKVPQVGSLVSIPFDGSGLFGSRGVSASFSESGDLTSIGFSSTGGADALAGVVDATTAAAGDLRDARLNNIKREIELRTKKKELEDLIDEKVPDK